MPVDTNAVGKGCALWLIPREPMFTVLADRISVLSRAYSTPLFDPHVTLASGITSQEQEIIAKSRLLASSLRPVHVELGEVGYLDEYFRCLFFRIVSADSIMKAHHAAQKAFGLQNEPAFEPHLSLLYGRLRLETRKKIAKDVASLSGQRLELDHLELYRVRGPLNVWKCLEKFDLR